MNKARLALFIGAAIIGFLIAFVDSRPHWDDTGITVGALVLTSFLLGAASPSRPWVWALAIGAWIPLAGILIRHDVSMLITLAFPLIGAYVGSFLRRLMTGSPTAA